MYSFKCLIGAALLVTSIGALAAETAGTYMTFNRGSSVSTLPDGTHARLVHYYHAGTSEHADSPFAGRTSECVARMILSKAGKVVSGAGYCYAQDAAGNGGSWIWRVTEAGTAQCPEVCGTFKWLEGYGTTKSATASGAWRQTSATSDGGVGTYKLTYSP